MAWINSCPEYSIPLALEQHVVDIAPIPHTPLLAVVTPSTLVIYHSKSLIPVTLRKRGSECLQSHGPTTSIHLRHITVDTVNLDQLQSVNVFVRTASNFVLVFHLLINYGKSMYQVCDSGDDDRLLQNALPLALGVSRFSFSNLLKTATRSIIHGNTGINLANLEHFNYGTYDDEERNEQIPSVRLTLAKIIKMSAPLLGFWCKPNSQNLIFAYDNQEIQLLNLKSSKNETISLRDLSWYTDTTAIEYSLRHNFFLHLNSSGQLSALQFVDEPNSSGLLLKPMPLLSINYKVEAILLNPQFDLVCLQSDTDVKIYAMYFTKDIPSLRYVKKIFKFERGSAYECHWSPCGMFLTVLDTTSGKWQTISRFGSTLFDSSWILSELSSSDLDGSKMSENSDYCQISCLTVSSNARHIYLINRDSSRLYSLSLLRVHEGNQRSSLLCDDQYIIIPSQNGNSLTKYPLLPLFQKVVSRFNCINGSISKHAQRKLTGKFTLGSNAFDQLSLSYGPHLSISTPVRFGDEINQPLWFTFYNHLSEAMNFVNHFWLGDYLVAISRFHREEGNATADSNNEDLIVDELIIIGSSGSRHGAGGTYFKFDSDQIVWRHAFKSQIVNYELVDTNEKESHVLNLITNDLKIILMQISTKSPKQDSSGRRSNSKIQIRIKKTIHLSSIKHKLPIRLVRQFFSVQGKHFLFLLNNGDFFFLRNQLPDSHLENTRGPVQTNNMYDLILVKKAVEAIYLSGVQFENHEEQTRYLTLVTGKYAFFYELNDLVERVYDYEGVEYSGEKRANDEIVPIEIPHSTFLPLQMNQNGATLEISGIEFQSIIRSDKLLVKYKIGRQMVLSNFIAHDLFELDVSFDEIKRKYAGFQSFDYCLEFLLFEYLEDDNTGNKEKLQKVCELVDVTTSADSIYVNFLRKIEVRYWDKFFALLKQTPEGFMNRLIESNDVELCYSYLNVYLNFKRESESSTTLDSCTEQQPILVMEDRQLITKIIGMLADAEKYDECFELCRFIKLLEPSGELLKKIRSVLA